ncbi:MAG: replication protein [Methylococcales bacterium]|nr:replication protein [Methylococcales bacterium]
MSGFTRTDNNAFDLGAASLSHSAFKLLYVISRKTVGWNKPSDYISHSQLKKLSNIKDDRTIKNSLSELVNAGMITMQSRSGKAAIFSVTFFVDHQQKMQDPHQKTQIDQPQKLRTYNIKNTKDTNHKSEGKTTTPQPEVLPDSIDQKSLDDFTEHRKQIGKPLAGLSRQKLITTLAALTVAQQRQVIDYSISGGYSGIFIDRLAGGSNGGINSTAARIRGFHDFLESMGRPGEQGIHQNVGVVRGAVGFPISNRPDYEDGIARMGSGPIRFD